MIRLRGGPLSIHIKGLDELQLTHDNIMMESCNTSFQVHFQSNAKDFANHYNIAQAITAPVWQSPSTHRFCLDNVCGRKRASRCFSTRQTSARVLSSHATNPRASTSASAGCAIRWSNCFTIRSHVSVPS